jgi:hypothetical protein
MDPIIIEALLVSGEGERVRVILDPYCLDFGADDILDLEELPLPAGITEGDAVAARVTLRPGARLMGLGFAAPYRNLLWHRDLPFALATRPNLFFELDPAMKERENAFLASRGLLERFS